MRSPSSPIGRIGAEDTNLGEFGPHDILRSSWNVRQPNHALTNPLAGHKAERRPLAREEWRAATQHDGWK